MRIFFIYVTCPSLEVAKSISQELLERRIIGCANIFPVTAKYHWEGVIVEENEVVMILKTLDNLVDKVVNEVKNLHPYQTPCIAQIPVIINEPFGQWLEGELSNFI